MAKETTISEFRRLVTSKLLFEKMARTNITNYELLLLNMVFSCNDVLSELGIESVLVRKRNSRAFMFHKTTKRIVCEMGLTVNKSFTNPEVFVVNLRGIVPDTKYLESIISDVERLGKRQPKERKVK